MSCGKRLKHLGALGLNSDKDNENDIKRAYKKMALKYHPDKNPGDENATRKFQEISEAYRFLAEGAKDSSDDDWQSDSDSGSDYGPRFRFHGGGGTYSYVDPDDDLLLFFLLSQMFENRRGPTSASYSRGDSGRTRYKPSTQYRTPTREKSPTVEAKQAPSYEESEKDRIKREKRQAKKKRQKERRNNEKNIDKKDDKENKDQNKTDENQNESKKNGAESRGGSPDVPDDEDEAKLLYEFLADKHGFQPDKDSTPDGSGKGPKKDTNKTFEEWKAERQGGKSKSEIQAEQKKRDEEAKSIGEELKKKAQMKEEKEKKQKAKQQQKQKEEKERKEKDEEEKRQREVEAEAKRKKKQEEELAAKKMKQKQNETKNNKNDNKTADVKAGGSKGVGGGQKTEAVAVMESSASESESEEESYVVEAYFEAAAPKETKEATSDAGFVSAKKVSKVQKVVDKERINTQKKLPEFMLKESDPIKRMKYKTEICKLYLQTGVCPKRDYCVYAHGKHEMRLKPKCQMCFKWQAGYCPFMEDPAQCVFAHGEDEFQPEFAEIYLTIHPELAAKNAAAAAAALATASRPPPPAPNPYVLEQSDYQQHHHHQPPQSAPQRSAVLPVPEPAPRGMVLGPRDADGGYVTIQPASEMEEMEMLRRAIEISMLEEKSRKTEQMLINKPMSLPKRLNVDPYENTVILGLAPQNVSPPPRNSRNDTAILSTQTYPFNPSFISDDKDHNLLSHYMASKTELSSTSATTALSDIDDNDTALIGIPSSNTLIPNISNAPSSRNDGGKPNHHFRQLPLRSPFLASLSESERTFLNSSPSQAHARSSSSSTSSTPLHHLASGTAKNDTAIFSPLPPSTSPFSSSFGSNVVGNDSTSVGGSDSSLFPSFHNESPVTGLSIYAAPAPPPLRTSGLSELRQNSEPLRDSPTRALGNLAPIGTPPPPKQTSYYQQPPSMSHPNPGAPTTVGAPVVKSSAAAQQITSSLAAKSTRLPPGLGTSNFTPLATEEAKPIMNGFYDDTAVIMPSFENDPVYNFETEFQSDGSEEFVSDDEFDTPIFTGAPPTRQNLLLNPLVAPTMAAQSSQFYPIESLESQLLNSETRLPPQLLNSETRLPPQQSQLSHPPPKVPESSTKTAQMKNGTSVSINCQADCVAENITPASKTEEAKAAPLKSSASKSAGQQSANYQKRNVVYSNKLCKHGSLCWSGICPFRHPERENGGRATTPSEETKTLPPFKMRECWKFMKYGDCQYGSGCHFAHGKHDLRSFDSKKAN